MFSMLRTSPGYILHCCAQDGERTAHAYEWVREDGDTPELRAELESRAAGVLERR